jgi:hypothetical protein
MSQHESDEPKYYSWTLQDRIHELKCWKKENKTVDKETKLQLKWNGQIAFLASTNNTTDPPLLIRIRSVMSHSLSSSSFRMYNVTYDVFADQKKLESDKLEIRKRQVMPNLRFFGFLPSLYDSQMKYDGRYARIIAIRRTEILERVKQLQQLGHQLRTKSS